MRACLDRYLICTKPFNCRGTTLYTIVDLQDKVRGREDLILGASFETDEDCRNALARVSSGLTGISHRHRGHSSCAVRRRPTSRTTATSSGP